MADNLLSVKDGLGTFGERQPATAASHTHRVGSEGRWLGDCCGAFGDLCDLLLSAYQ